MPGIYQSYHGKAFALAGSLVSIIMVRTSATAIFWWNYISCFHVVWHEIYVIIYRGILLHFVKIVLMQACFFVSCF